MYRALALKAIENDLAFDEEEPLLALAARRGLCWSRRSRATGFCWMEWMFRDEFARAM